MHLCISKLNECGILIAIWGADKNCNDINHIIIIFYLYLSAYPIEIQEYFVNNPLHHML